MLKNLVRTRARLVKQRVALQNQAGEHTGIAPYLAQAIASVNESVGKLDKQIIQAAKCRPQHRLLMKIPGFGPLVSAYMLAMLASGPFRSSDAFAAFIGLDLRVRESGKLKGRRKLSKRGDPEARRLLYLAALAAKKQTPFNTIYLRALDNGYSKTEAVIIVARKLARVAWAIYTKGEIYNPYRVLAQRTTQALDQPITRCLKPTRVVEPRPSIADRKTPAPCGYLLIPEPEIICHIKPGA